MGAKELVEGEKGKNERFQRANVWVTWSQNRSYLLADTHDGRNSFVVRLLWGGIDIIYAK